MFVRQICFDFMTGLHSHFPEWINAWPFTNTYTKTSDPSPTSSMTKITGSVTHISLHRLSEEEVQSLSTSELDVHSCKVMGKNAWAVAEEVCLRIDDSPVPHAGYISTILVDRPENQFFYNREYLGVTNNRKEFCSGAWVFFQARTIWEPPLWERRAIYGV